VNTLYFSKPNDCSQISKEGAKEIWEFETLQEVTSQRSVLALSGIWGDRGLGRRYGGVKAVCNISVLYPAVRRQGEPKIWVAMPHFQPKFSSAAKNTRIVHRLVILFFLVPAN
jgi:hypothetical protein